jgi:anthranilate phosphoribosyltransferase
MSAPEGGAPGPAQSLPDTPIDLPAAIARVVDRQNLTRAEARGVMDSVMAGDATSAQIAAFLIALRMKGETVEEIAGAAEAMRAAAMPVHSSKRPVIDTCGTGGDGRGTLNISTAAALVAAGGGVVIAKHGNRAVSSRSGSADVLEALGVRIDLTCENISACLDEVGIAFLFAPILHPAMRHALGPRREIRIRTLFNILGPLTNPARAERQVLGVFAPYLAPLLARVLGELGSDHALVVHGAGGEDELSLGGENLAIEVRSGEDPLRSLGLRAGDLGLREIAAGGEELRGGDAAANARWIHDLLDGSVLGPSLDTVILNAAAAFYVSGKAADLKDGCALARESIDSGAAKRILDRLRATTQKLGGTV